MMVVILAYEYMSAILCWALTGKPWLGRHLEESNVPEDPASRYMGRTGLRADPVVCVASPAVSVTCRLRADKAEALPLVSLSCSPEQLLLQVNPVLAYPCFFFSEFPCR